MLIGFDASRAFVAEATGTENYSLNLLRALAKIDRRNRYRVYLRDFPFSNFQFPFIDQLSNRSISKSKINGQWPMANGKFRWPSNFEPVPIRPSRFWTQAGLALETWKNPVDLLFVPAHTLPILRRRRIGFSNLHIPFSNYFELARNKLSYFPFNNFSNRKSKNRKSMANGQWSMVNRTKYVVTIHDLGVEYLPGYHQFPQRYYLDFASNYAAHHADALVAVSAATKADIVKRYKVSAKKVFVVHEGVDAAFFRPSSRLKVKSVKSKYKMEGDYILFVGTVQPRKNLQMLIRAFANLVGSRQLVVSRRNKKTTDYKLQATNLVIAGKLGWDYQDILDLPKKLGIGNRVKFLGHVAGADLPALYTGASVFAFPSLFEGFGLPILEAISCGCPVIASDIAPHREIYKKIFHFPSSNFHLFKNSSIEKLKINGKWPMVNGQSRENLEAIILVKPDDVDEWVRVLYQSISQDRKSVSNKSKIGEILAKFSWEDTAKNTLRVFEQVLSHQT